jgi:hypothetical protein
MDDYASDVTRKAKASWDRRRMDAIARWGSLDRLASKCSPETAAKFAKANGRMKEARGSADEFEYARRLGVMERGVDALEQEALKNGSSPSDMTWFDLQTRVGDRRAVAVMNPQDAEYVAATLGRELGDDFIVYTAADIVMMAHENPTALTHLKQVAGAYTTHVDVNSSEEAGW